DEVKELLDEIAGLNDEAMVVFTGGEPLLRSDLEVLAHRATNLGLMVVIGTNGTLLDKARVSRLMKAGVAGAGISLDSLDPDYHDKFRGMPGSWEKAMAGIDACRNAGLAFQIHFSVTDDNAHELEAMIAFARSSGAAVFNLFFLVCTGRGEQLTDISRDTHDDVLARVTKAAHEEDGLIVRAKCAPHFKRLALEMDPSWPITLAQGYEAGGCLAGTRYCRVTPEGEVTACPYMEKSVGSVREQPLAQTWNDAPLFNSLRNPRLGGRCGVCEYRKICGGCRARPAARSDDPMGEDFLCTYEPQDAAVIEPLFARDEGLIWTRAAEDRLKRVPSFLRRMVRGRVETYVSGLGRKTVTPDDLQTLAKRRFGEAGPPKTMPGGPDAWGKPDV
ncbi:MAG: radical SAM protein, partial [Rhodospirillales bacterium]|nr:radical SAM protein [Rhodospirillales bacterium]